MSDSDESLMDELPESGPETAIQEELDYLTKDPLPRLIVKISFMVIVYLIGFIIADAITGNTITSLAMGVILPLLLAWPFFAPKARRPVLFVSTARSMRKKQMPLGQPETIISSDLAYRYSFIDEVELRESTMYDSQRHWIVTVMMFFKPHVVRIMDDTVEIDGHEPMPVKLGVWRWVGYHLILLAGVIATLLWIVPKDTQNGWSLLAALVYLLYGAYIVWLSGRNRLVITARTMEKFRRQTPWQKERNIPVPAAQLTQFDITRSVFGKIFGWSDANILTKEETEQIGRIRFARDHLRLQSVLKWLQKHHAPDMRDVQVDETPSPLISSEDVTQELDVVQLPSTERQPTTSYRHYRRPNPGGRPPR